MKLIDHRDGGVYICHKCLITEFEYIGSKKAKCMRCGTIYQMNEHQVIKEGKNEIHNKHRCR